MTAEAQHEVQTSRVPGARCNSCGHFWHPRPRHCPECLGDSFTDESVAGDGVVYSATVVRSGRNDRPLPYGLAHVDLAAGIRVMAGFDPTDGQVIEPGHAVVVDQVGTSEAGLPLLKATVAADSVAGSPA